MRPSHEMILTGTQESGPRNGSARTVAGESYSGGPRTTRGSSWNPATSSRCMRAARAAPSWNRLW
jgi:hypothetical protein